MELQSAKDDAPDAVKNEVNFDSRSTGDMPCAIIFGLTMLVHLCLGVYMLAAANVTMPKPVKGDNSTFVHVEYSDSLNEDIAACNAAHPDRRLQIEVGQDAEIWSIFSQYPQIPAVMICMIVAIGVVWLALLQKFAKPIVWATAVIKTAVFVLIGVWLNSINAQDVAIMCFVGAGLFAVATFMVRAKISKAAEHLEIACTALIDEPGAFAAAAVLKTMYLVYLAFYCVVVINSYLIWEVDYATYSHCYPVPATWASRMTTFNTVCLMWMTYFTSAAKCHVTAVSVAVWYFDQKENRPKHPALTALKHVFTTSAGTLAIASLVTTIAERLLATARSKFWWTNPWGCLLKVILCMVQTLIETLTKFTVIVHAIHGMAFFTSAKTCFKILKRHFVGAVVTDQVGTSVLHLGAYTFSVAVGFAAWAWVDDVKGWDTLNPNGWGEDWKFVFYIFLVLFVYLTYYPLPTIFLVALTSTYVTGVYSAPLCAVFCSAVANILLTYISDVVLNAMDTVFLCYAIAKDNQQAPVAGREKMYVLLQEMPEAIECGQLVGGAPMAVAVNQQV